MSTILNIDIIRRDGDIQSREAIDKLVAEDYANEMANGALFPPVTVYFDGEHHWLADGFHRIEAAIICELESFQCDVIEGTRRDAILHSVGANSSHGLRRTNADKRRAVMTLLDDEEWSQWSDREIARRCAVSQPFVSNMRSGLSDNGYQIERKVSRGGTTYTQNITNIGSHKQAVIDAVSEQAPDRIKAAVSDGDITYDQANDLMLVLAGAAEPIQHAADKFSITEPETIRQLIRLYKRDREYCEIVCMSGTAGDTPLTASPYAIIEAIETARKQRTQARIETRRQEAAQTPPPEGRYRTIVIDPPWPVQKIERDVRPNQSSELDYPTMTLDQIAALPVPELADERGCHLYLWTTQKFLPTAIDLAAHWGFNYQCILTWVKPTGMTPYSWMYNTEHIVFARLGNLKLKRNGVKLGFDAPTNGHSVKPDAFYNRVIECSHAPRLEMFARRNRDGFFVWGNEVIYAP